LVKVKKIILVPDQKLKILKYIENQVEINLKNKPIITNLQKYPIDITHFGDDMGIDNVIKYVKSLSYAFIGCKKKTYYKKLRVLITYLWWEASDLHPITPLESSGYFEPSFFNFVGAYSSLILSKDFKYFMFGYKRLIELLEISILGGKEDHINKDRVHLYLTSRNKILNNFVRGEKFLLRLVFLRIIRVEGYTRLVILGQQDYQKGRSLKLIIHSKKALRGIKNDIEYLIDQSKSLH